jgi:hypothetical protein
MQAGGFAKNPISAFPGNTAELARPLTQPIQYHFVESKFSQKRGL